MIMRVPVGDIIETNAYFYVEDKSRRGVVIDPGGEADKLLGIIRERRFSIEKILLTHGHFDHMGAAQELADKLAAPIVMHEKGREYAANTLYNLSEIYGMDMRLADVTFLPDESRIDFADDPECYLTLLHVPGHTSDGAAYLAHKDPVVFVGDTVFRNSYGRTDLYGGDENTLLHSIKTRLFTLPDDTVLLSGHSEPTTVKEEKMRPWYAV